MSNALDFPGFGAPPAALPLPTQAFDHASGKWVPVPAGGDARVESLTVATWNAWFQGPDRERRIRGVLDVLESSGADVIFLQEATRPLLDALHAAEWVRAAYGIASAPVREDAVPSHGLVHLSRLPCAGAVLHPLPTHMGRRLLLSEARVNEAPLAFAAVHLESMKVNADTRARQLQSIFTLLDPYADVLLAGDFNFCSSWTEEDARLDPRFRDVWPEVNPVDPGYTQDTDRNAMLARAKREVKRVRIDRILLRSDSRRWRPEHCRLIGTEPLDGGSTLFPSDHFGLLATLRIP